MFFDSCEKNNFYIYRWVRLDTNTPFYVGKGTGRRAKKIHNRNSFFKNIYKSTKAEVEIILENLTEEQAFIKEIEFIKMYKNLGYCEANLTTGGEGVSGHKHSPETKIKMSEARIGKPLSEETRRKISEVQKGREGKPLSEEAKIKISRANKGRKHSEISKAKMSEAQKGNKNNFGKPLSEETKRKLSRIKFKPVICVETGQIFESTSEAAKILNLHASNISSICRGERKYTGGYSFTFKKRGQTL